MRLPWFRLLRRSPDLAPEPAKGPSAAQDPAAQKTNFLFSDTEALRGLYLTRGRAYADLGEVEEAERAFRREIELSPASLAPYTHLALLYALIGQGSESGSTLRQMVETNPSPHAYAEAVRTLRLIGDAGSASLVLRQATCRWPESPELRELAG